MRKLLSLTILLICGTSSHALNKTYDTLVAQWKTDTTLTVEAIRNKSQLIKADIDNSAIDNALTIAESFYKKEVEEEVQDIMENFPNIDKIGLMEVMGNDPNTFSKACTKDFYYWYNLWRYRTMLVAQMLAPGEPKRRDYGMKLGGITSNYDPLNKIVEQNNKDYCLATIDSITQSLKTMPYVKTFVKDEIQCLPAERQNGKVDSLCALAEQEKAEIRLNYEMMGIVKNFIEECLVAKGKGEGAKKMMQKYCTEEVVKQRKGKLEKDWLPKKTEIKNYNKRDIWCKPTDKTDKYRAYTIKLVKISAEDQTITQTTPLLIAVDINSKKIVLIEEIEPVTFKF